MQCHVIKVQYKRTREKGTALSQDTRHTIQHNSEVRKHGDGVTADFAADIKKIARRLGGGKTSKKIGVFAFYLGKE